MTIFISGPITGNKEYETDFRLGEMVLEREGHKSINPADMPEGLTRADYMRVSLAQVEAADAILMLPGYENSGGAMIEKQYAEYLGKRVFFLNLGTVIHPDDNETILGPITMKEEIEF